MYIQLSYDIFTKTNWIEIVVLGFHGGRYSTELKSIEWKIRNANAMRSNYTLAKYRLLFGFMFYWIIATINCDDSDVPCLRSFHFLLLYGNKMKKI